MRKRLTLILIGMMSAGAHVREAQADPPKIWVSHTQLPTAADAYFGTYGAAIGYSVPRVVFDVDDDASFDGNDDASLSAWLDENVDEGYDGPIALDYEGLWSVILYTGVGNSTTYLGNTVNVTQTVYDDAIQTGIYIMNFIGKLRPYSLRGYYDMPLRGGFSDGETKWHTLNDPLEYLFNSCTALFPHCYDYYNDDVGEFTPSGRSQLDEMGSKLELALGVGEDVGIPVFPFVWYRWHGSGNVEVANHLIGEEEFGNFVQEMFDRHSNSVYIAGILWWGSEVDFHYYSLQPLPGDFTVTSCHDAFSEEMPTNPHYSSPSYPDGYMDWPFYRDSLMLRRLVILSNIAYGEDYPLPVRVNDAGLPLDTAIVAAHPNTNEDGLNLVVGVGGSNPNRSLMDFGDLNTIGAPADSLIPFSSLTLNCLTAAGSAKAFSVHPMTQLSWVETQATWNIYRTSFSWTTAGGDFQASSGVTSGFTLPTATGVYSYDIASTLQWVLDNASGACDFIIKRDSEGDAGQAIFDSAEGGTEPWLAFMYIPPDI